MTTMSAASLLDNTACSMSAAVSTATTSTPTGRGRLAAALLITVTTAPRLASSAAIA